MIKKGRKPKHPTEKYVRKTHTFPPTLYTQFKKWCGTKPVSEVVTSLIMRAMDMDTDVLSLGIQIEEVEGDIASVKYKESKYKVEKENLQTSLLSLRERRDYLMQEERYRDIVEERHNKFVKETKEEWAPRLKKWWDSNPPPLSEIRKRTTFFDDLTDLQARAVLKVVYSDEEELEVSADLPDLFTERV